MTEQNKHYNKKSEEMYELCAKIKNLVENRLISEEILIKSKDRISKLLE